MPLLFPALAPSRLTGKEQFVSGAERMSVLAFWRWAVSNLADNTTRRLLAEYIVAAALGVDQGVRSAWDAFDLRTESGIRVEVKSCAYLQAWAHEKLSTIRFSIRSSREWDATTGRYAKTRKRQADVYVFALLKHQDKATLNPLDLTQWEFYIVPTSRIEQECGERAAMSLKEVQQLAGGGVSLGELRAAVEAAGQAPV